MFPVNKLNEEFPRCLISEIIAHRSMFPLIFTQSFNELKILLHLLKKWKYFILSQFIYEGTNTVNFFLTFERPSAEHPSRWCRTWSKPHVFLFELKKNTSLIALQRITLIFEVSKNYTIPFFPPLIAEFGYFSVKCCTLDFQNKGIITVWIWCFEKNSLKPDFKGDFS